ncbi:MAG: AAA family ATPase [Polyangiaceae bacterium]
MPRSQTRFVFGPFEADERRFELRRRGEVVPLQRRTLEVLFFLLKNRGVLLDKQAFVEGPGGGVLVGESATYRAVMLARRALEDDGRASFIVTVRGKGYRFEGDVLELDCAPGEAATATTSITSDEPQGRLLGRDAELAQLRRQLATVRSGRGITVVISGPAGIGKTALAEAFAGEVAQRGIAVVQGRSWEGDGAPALLPWAEIVRALLTSRGDVPQGATPPGFVELLARLVPELAPTSAVPDAIPDQGAHARFRLFEALAHFLVTRATPGPLLLLLEDLQSADEASRLMLQFLRRSMRSAPLLVLVTLRECDGPEPDGVRELLDAGAEDVTHLPLKGLGEADVQCLLERCRGAAPSPGIVASVCQLTEGNPLWVGELVRGGFLDGLDSTRPHAPWQAVPVPERAHAWLARRMRLLSPEAVRIVQGGAVLGRTFSWPLLAELLELPLPEGLSALRHALDSGLIEAGPGPSGEFRFRHALFRDAVYAAMASDLRYELHARAVSVLATTEHDPDLRRVARLAHHAAAAIPLLGSAPAIEHGLSAVHQARQLCSYELAAWHANQVLGFHRLAATTTSEAHWQAWLAVAECEALAGHTSAAMQSFEAIMSACLASDDGDAFARAVLSCFQHARELAVISPVFHERVREALNLHQEPDALRARLLAAQALLVFFYFPASLRIEQAEHAIELARKLGDTHSLLFALRHGHFPALTPWTQARAGARVDEMSRLADAQRDPIARLEAHFWCAQFALETGNGQAFHGELLAHARLAQSIRHPMHLWYAAMLDSVQALLAGQLVRAVDKAHAALTLGLPAAGAATVHSYVGGQLLAIAWLEQGARRRALFEELQRMGEYVLTLAPTFAAWRLATLFARLELEGPASLLSDYESAADGFEQVPEDAYFFVCVALFAQLAIHFGDTLRLQQLQRRLSLRPSSIRGQHVSVTTLYLGPLSFHLARIAEALSDFEAALTWYQHAAAEAQRLGAVSWRRAAQRASEALSRPLLSRANS